MVQGILQAPVTAVILIITTAVSVAAFYNKRFKSLFVLHPYSVRRGKRWHTLLSSSLVHNDWLHLLFNLFGIYVFAFKLENDFALRSNWGHLQLGVLYLLSIFFSSGGTVIRYRKEFLYSSLGSSGGVLALMMSYILFHPFDKLHLMPFLPPLPLVAMPFIFIFGLVYAEKKRKKYNVNNYAHFIGCVSGVVITAIYYPALLLEILNRL